MKKAFIVVLAILTLTSCGKQEIYPRTMIVAGIDEANNRVILKDGVGYQWEISGVEDWEIGDLCSCIMDTNGTEIITDDSILVARYSANPEC